MAKISVSVTSQRTSSHLYSIDDVKRVNEIRVKSFSSSYGIDRFKPKVSNTYSLNKLNDAWKKISKK